MDLLQVVVIGDRDLFEHKDLNIRPDNGGKHSRYFLYSYCLVSGANVKLIQMDLPIDSYIKPKGHGNMRILNAAGTCYQIHDLSPMPTIIATNTLHLSWC